MFKTTFLTLLLFLCQIAQCYADEASSYLIPSITDLFTAQLSKYDPLFQTRSKNEFDQYDDENEKPRIWESLFSLKNQIIRPKKYKQQQKMKYRQYSSEATAERQAELNQKYAENLELDRIHASKEVILDKSINNKLYERFQKRVHDNFNERFRPTTLLIHPDELVMYSENTHFDTDIKRQLQAEDKAKTDATPVVIPPVVDFPPNMNPNVLPDVQLYTIEEYYPDQKSQNKALHCQNGAKVMTIEQNYYVCYDNAEKSTKYRVDYDTYRNLTILPYFQLRMTCNVVPTSNDVCFCPSGFTDYLCNEAAYTKCYVNVTSPALYKGCKDRTDSDYYVYSIQGFDPCNSFNFEKNLTVKFLLNCRPIDTKSVVLENGHPEGLGYTYMNVLNQKDFENVKVDFNYAAVNNQTNLKVVADQSIVLAWDFRDWKYLSHLTRFMGNFTDPEILAGNKEGELELDLPKVIKNDQSKKSSYEVGGRLFYEAHVFAAQGLTTFTTNGFFDREGYIEPQMSETAANMVTPIVICLSVVCLAATVYLCGLKTKISDVEETVVKIEKRRKAKQVPK